jgi:hypothetical protein
MRFILLLDLISKIESKKDMLGAGILIMQALDYKDDNKITSDQYDLLLNVMDEVCKVKSIPQTINA